MTKRCKFIILISEMTAGGKSTVAKEFLFSTKHLGIKFGYVPGDTVAHLFF